MEMYQPKHSENFSRKTNESITVPLQYLKLDKAMEILGVYLAPDGNNRDQVE